MLTCATLFSGGGGADLGFYNAGFTPIWGIEYDEKIAQLYKLNFGHSPFGDILESNPYNFDRPNLLHASPPCISFSGAKALPQELKLDRQLATKICEFLECLKPDFFTLENVPRYLNSTSFAQITNALHTLEYFTVWEVVDAANFGAPTNRSRLILRAARQDKNNQEPPLPLIQTHAQSPQLDLFGIRQKPWRTWWEAIEDIFDSLPDVELTPSQERSLKSNPQNDSYNPYPVIIQRVGYRKHGNVTRTHDRPCWTILATLGDDWHGGNRNKVIDVVYGDRIKTLNARALARIQSFTDNYKLPPEFGASKLYRAIGNAVPPILATAIGKSLQDSTTATTAKELATLSK